MRSTVISAVAAALVLAACGGGSDGTADQAADAPSTPAATAPPADASGLEPRPLALANGSTVDFNSLLGQDVLFWFWAPW